jgi:hypothetical protein
MLSLRVARAAEAFWRDNPAAATFPRDMVAAVSWALPVSIVRLPRLRPRSVRRWLASERGGATLADTVPADDRPLCGCLSPFAGGGFIFVDSSDPPDEIRFTIAHEAAHFMLDYLEPRERLARTVAPSSIEVFDGVRRATAGERVAAAISGAELELRTQLFARDGAGSSLCAATGEAEQDADALALELLAPAAHVLAGWQEAPDRALWDRPVAGLTDRLQRVYGLPEAVAGLYARRLLAEEDAGSFETWLGSLRNGQESGER